MNSSNGRVRKVRRSYKPIVREILRTYSPLPEVLIPMKVIGDSDWIPVTGSEMKLIVFGAKQHWRSYRA